MKRIVKIKKVSVLCLISLWSINSFAASISNNDGSAFITNELSEHLIQFNFS